MAYTFAQSPNKGFIRSPNKARTKAAAVANVRVRVYGHNTFWPVTGQYASQVGVLYHLGYPVPTEYIDQIELIWAQYPDFGISTGGSTASQIAAYEAVFAQYPNLRRVMWVPPNSSGHPNAVIAGVTGISEVAGASVGANNNYQTGAHALMGGISSSGAMTFSTNVRELAGGTMLLEVDSDAFPGTFRPCLRVNGIYVVGGIGLLQFHDNLWTVA